MSLDALHSCPHVCIHVSRYFVSTNPSQLETLTNKARLGTENEGRKKTCQNNFVDTSTQPDFCSKSDTERFEEISGGWGGFNRSLTAAAMEPDRLSNEVFSFAM